MLYSKKPIQMLGLRQRLEEAITPLVGFKPALEDMPNSCLAGTMNTFN